MSVLVALAIGLAGLKQLETKTIDADALSAAFRWLAILRADESQHVAHTTNSLQNLRSAGAIIQLRAQAGNLNVHGTIERNIGRSTRNLQ
jgi:hypothetical protein